MAEGRVLWVLPLGPGHGIPVIICPRSCVGWSNDRACRLGSQIYSRSGHRNHLGAVIAQLHGEDVALALFYIDGEDLGGKLIIDSDAFQWKVYGCSRTKISVK